MGTTDAVAGVSEALVEVLRRARGTAPSELRLREGNIQHVQASGITNPPDGIALWLYRITPGLARHRPAPGTSSTGEPLRPPILLDLHYLVLATASDALQQQRLLGWCVRALEDVSIVPGGLLRATPFRSAFDLRDEVEVIFEAIAWTDLTTIWNVAQSKLAPCATYVVRNVAVDSSVPLEGFGEVQTREFAMGAVTDPS